MPWKGDGWEAPRITMGSCGRGILWKQRHRTQVVGRYKLHPNPSKSHLVAVLTTFCISIYAGCLRSRSWRHPEVSSLLLCLLRCGLVHSMSISPMQTPGDFSTIYLRRCSPRKGFRPTLYFLQWRGPLSLGGKTEEGTRQALFTALSPSWWCEASVLARG